MRFILLLLSLFLVTVLAMGQQKESTAMQILLHDCPQLSGGGDSVESFASWANGRYLLREGLYAGPVTSLGDNIRAELFLCQQTPVLACWAAKGDTPVSIALGSRAKFYSWGGRTRSLTGKNLEITATAFPQFIRNVAGSYLLEAVVQTIQRAQLTEDDGASLLDEVQHIFGEIDKETLQRQLSIVSIEMTTVHKRERLEQLEGFLDRLLQQCLLNSAKKDREQSHLAFRLVHFRLQVLEAHLALLQWQRLLPKSRPFSDLERMHLLDTALPLLSIAAPKDQLRGFPEVSKLLNAFITDLAHTGKTFLPREQSRCLYLIVFLSRLVELEPQAVQNLQFTLKRTTFDNDPEYLLQIWNNSQEDATGMVIASWVKRKIEIPITILPGKSVIVSLGKASTLPLGANITISGALTDHTPLNPITFLLDDATVVQE